MKKIDLRRIVNEMAMPKKEIADHIFPGNKFPVMALDRVMKGEAVLNADQISRLSAISGIPIGDLFGEWRMESKKGIHKLSNGNYTAEMDTTDMIVRIFHNDSLFHEEIIYDNKMSVSELINIINIQIKNYESN